MNYACSARKHKVMLGAPCCCLRTAMLRSSVCTRFWLLETFPAQLFAYTVFLIGEVRSVVKWPVLFLAFVSLSIITDVVLCFLLGSWLSSDYLEEKRTGIQFQSTLE